MKISNGVTLIVYSFFLLIGALIDNCIYISLLVISLLEIYKQIKNDNFITTYTFWQMGFAFIICLDGILSKAKVISATSFYVYNKTGIIFSVSAILIIWYYRRLEKKTKTEYVEESESPINVTFFFVIAFLYILFLINELPEVINSLTVSRFKLIGDDEFGGLNAQKSILKQLGIFLSQFSGYLLPSLIFIWNLKRTTPWKAFFNASFLSLPIWIIYVIIGTRHNVLYSFFGLLACFSLVKFSKFKFKPIYLLFLFLAYFVSNTMLEARKHGFINYITGNINPRYAKLEKNVTDQTTVYMSYVIDYYDEKPLLYGKSTATILFFWIPRKIWPDKPPQFSYWFIREYLGGQIGFNSKHSAPGSYLSVPYSDFGYTGIVLISIFIGFLLNRLDMYFRKNRMLNDYKKLVFVSFFLASIFFLPRQLSHLVSKVLMLYLLLGILFYLNKTKFILKTNN